MAETWLVPALTEGGQPNGCVMRCATGEWTGQVAQVQACGETNCPGCPRLTVTVRTNSNPTITTSSWGPCAYWISGGFPSGDTVLSANMDPLKPCIWQAHIGVAWVRNFLTGQMEPPGDAWLSLSFGNGAYDLRIFKDGYPMANFAFWSGAFGACDDMLQMSNQLQSAGGCFGQGPGSPQDSVWATGGAYTINASVDTGPIVPAAALAICDQCELGTSYLGEPACGHETMANNEGAPCNAKLTNLIARGGPCPHPQGDKWAGLRRST